MPQAQRDLAPLNFNSITVEEANFEVSDEGCTAGSVFVKAMVNHGLSKSLKTHSIPLRDVVSTAVQVDQTSEEIASLKANL